MKIAKENVKEFIKENGNKIFSVEFIKKNGERRKMTARLGVTSHLKGGRNNVERPDRSYITVFDMQKRAYRTVNLRTLKKLKVTGKEYKIC